MALSVDLRKRVLDDHHAGLSNTRIAEKYSVGRSSVERWIARFKETGSLEPLSPPGRTPKIDEHARDLLRQWLAKENDLTIEELRERWSEHGYPVASSTVGEWLERLRLSHKKKRCAPANRTGLTCRRSVLNG
jgi:putative transposase